MSHRIYPGARKPRAFVPLWAIGAEPPREPMSLTYSPDRGFFEAVTNKDAPPVIGRILCWTYRHDSREADDAAHGALIAEAARILETEKDPL